MKKPSSKRRQAGFTLMEILVAASIGAMVIMGAVSIYIYISKDARALNYQVDFNTMARALQADFVTTVETNHYVRIDTECPGLGILLFAADGHESWVGYIPDPGGSVSKNKIVFRPNGKEDDQGERTLCDWVTPWDGEEYVFILHTGLSVELQAHIGDSANRTSDFTGPGRQGVNVKVVGSCHDLRRKIL